MYMVVVLLEVNWDISKQWTGGSHTKLVKYNLLENWAEVRRRLGELNTHMTFTFVEIKYSWEIIHSCHFIFGFRQIFGFWAVNVRKFLTTFCKPIHKDFKTISCPYEKKSMYSSVEEGWINYVTCTQWRTVQLKRECGQWLWPDMRWFPGDTRKWTTPM